MKKYMIAVLLTLLVAGVVYAAAEPSISGKGTSTLIVKNDSNDAIEGEICVYYKDAEDQKRSTSIKYKVDAKKSQNISIPGVIDGWSTLYCTVIESYK